MLSRRPKGYHRAAGTASVSPWNAALAQHEAVERGATAHLAMFTGIFHLPRATVTAPAIVRPGSHDRGLTVTGNGVDVKPSAGMCVSACGGAYTRQLCPIAWAVTRKAR